MSTTAISTQRQSSGSAAGPTLKRARVDEPESTGAASAAANGVQLPDSWPCSDPTNRHKGRGHRNTAKYGFLYVASAPCIQCIQLDEEECINGIHCIRDIALRFGFTPLV